MRWHFQSRIPTACKLKLRISHISSDGSLAELQASDKAAESLASSARVDTAFVWFHSLQVRRVAPADSQPESGIDPAGEFAYICEQTLQYPPGLCSYHILLT